MALNVLYSFPSRIGSGRICHTAWQQANQISLQGTRVYLSTVSLNKDVHNVAGLKQTLAWKKWKLPIKLIGRLRSFEIHDILTAKWLERNNQTIDVIHCWPLGSKRTLKTASKCRIPSFLERPNAHTKFAFEASKKECERLGLALPKGHDHSYDEKILLREEEEYQLADYLLCPSEFVAKTFLDFNFEPSKLLRHQYGYDSSLFPTTYSTSKENQQLKFLYAGSCEPRKGLHYILEAWKKSQAYENATLDVCGGFVPGYKDSLGDLAHLPNVRFLGHCTDLPKRMRNADVFTLASVEEGSALVTYEARASGCVLAVSDSTGAHCTHEFDSLVHPAGNTDELAKHFSQLIESKDLLKRLRANSLTGTSELTWESAGQRLIALYKEHSAVRPPTTKRSTP